MHVKCKYIWGTEKYVYIVDNVCEKHVKIQRDTT